MQITYLRGSNVQVKIVDGNSGLEYFSHRIDLTQIKAKRGKRYFQLVDPTGKLIYQMEAPADMRVLLTASVESETFSLVMLENTSSYISEIEANPYAFFSDREEPYYLLVVGGPNLTPGVLKSVAEKALNIADE